MHSQRARSEMRKRLYVNMERGMRGLGRVDMPTYPYMVLVDTRRITTTPRYSVTEPQETSWQATVCLLVCVTQDMTCTWWRDSDTAPSNEHEERNGENTCYGTHTPDTVRLCKRMNVVYNTHGTSVCTHTHAPLPPTTTRPHSRVTTRVCLTHLIP